MSLFDWNDSFSVGVAAMDTQHKRLVELVNRIYEAMRGSKGDQVVATILQELVVYTKTHFTAEETLMRKAGYPQLETHIVRHKALLEKVQQMTDISKSGKMVATVSLATFLKDWLVTHIQNEDRLYGIYIHQHQAVCV